MRRSRFARTGLLVGGAVLALLVLVTAVLSLGGADRYKPNVERAASAALGMQVRIGGHLGVGLLPGLHVTLGDAEILADGGASIASAKRVALGIRLLPMLRGQLRLSRIAITQPTLRLERDTLGGLNVVELRKAAALLQTVEGASLSITHANARYDDRRSGRGIELKDLDLDVDHVRLDGAGQPQLLSGLSLHAKLSCQSIRIKDVELSSLHASVVGRAGVFDVSSIEVGMFGGTAKGHIVADVSRAETRYTVRGSLARFRIEDVLRTVSDKKSASGVMDLSAELTLSGQHERDLLASSLGSISLAGEHLTLEGSDMDKNVARFESNTGFSLVDVGAVFFAGPVALSVTRGYHFANLFRGSGGSTRIMKLASDWTVEHGVAKAKDVAMATEKNRLALAGGLDFVNGRFEGVTLAVLDANGCARIQQQMRGTFDKPDIQKPRLLTTLASPLLDLLHRARGLLPSKPCTPFYTGSVAAPA